MTGSAREGAAAPEFHVPLLGGGYRGLGDLVEPGGGILLFFKTDCSTCGALLPRVGPLARALAREERLFLAVAQEEREGEAAAFRDAHGLAFPVAVEGPPYSASRAYGITTVPTLVLVDGAGIVAARLEGFVKREYLAFGAEAEQALALGDAPSVLERPDDLPDIKPG